MVRMRQLHRATDVEARTSRLRRRRDGEASVDSCGSLYQFDVTVSFEAAAARHEAPRGPSACPASLGGGS